MRRTLINEVIIKTLAITPRDGERGHNVRIYANRNSLVDNINNIYTRVYCGVQVFSTSKSGGSEEKYHQRGIFTKIVLPLALHKVHARQTGRQEGRLFLLPLLLLLLVVV